MVEAQPRDIRSAGVVTFRPGRQVLLVHRPKYNDWSFPKGKLDRGEHATAAAVREVAEETGLRVRLGPPVTGQRYRVGDRMKSVRYWTGRVVGDDDVGGYLVNAEIDNVAWVDHDDALEVLSYDRDRETLQEAVGLRHRTHTLVVLRHAIARSRRAWRGDDRRRPLIQLGRRQAERVAPVLAAYDVSRLVSSSSVRCVETLTPYAAVSGHGVEGTDLLTEEDARAKEVRRMVRDLVAGEDPAVVCTHRPVLPAVLDAVGLKETRLEPGAMLVVHLRRGAVASVECHLDGPR